MKPYKVTKKGIFKSRPNRFIAEVEIEKERVVAHVPNTGRLKELFIEGVEVICSYHDSPHRKTNYSVILVKKDNLWVSIDSQLPNKFVEECIQNKRILELSCYENYKREVQFEKSRFDFYLENENKKAFMEVKGCTLVERGVCKFPDAPTERGTKHVKELIKAKKMGYEAYLFFLIQREDVLYFTPNEAMDFEFSQAVKNAHLNGVEILCYATKVNEIEIILDRKIQIKV